MPDIHVRKRPLVFAIPGSKVYIGDQYRNSKGSFLNISVTGHSCRLQCRHCRGELLKDMVTAADSSALLSVTEKYMRRGNLNGMLISGGFDKNGKLVFGPLVEGMAIIKKRYPQLTIYIHTGFIDAAEAESLRYAGVDAVLVNLIKSQRAIRKVYNLEERTYRDYLDTISILKQKGLQVSPHIIVGLDNCFISDEYRMVEDAVALGADSIVFVVVKRVSRSIDFPISKIPDDEIIRLVRHARRLSRDVLLSFGCARPPDRDRHILEMGLIEAGIDSIAFPSEGTVRYVMENKLAHTFIEKCCANL